MGYEGADLAERIRQVGWAGSRKPPRIFEDTTEFMDIGPGDVIRLGHCDYLITSHAKEGRFGIDEQPKFWVKRAIDLGSGARRIVKLAFRETFKGRIGALEFACVRSPEKEAAVLAATAGHPNFMQGTQIKDCSGNLVRILDPLPGPSLYRYLRDLDLSHMAYFDTLFVQVMARFMESLAAIVYLHDLGLHHGDIRADHLLWTRDQAGLAWIDFDYDMGGPAMDVFCLGNVLQQVVGKGRHSLDDIRNTPGAYPDFKTTLEASDMSLMYPHRVMNLRKLFPHIPDRLNAVLMRFSPAAANGSATETPYARAADLLADLKACFAGHSNP